MVAPPLSSRPERPPGRGVERSRSSLPMKPHGRDFSTAQPAAAPLEMTGGGNRGPQTASKALRGVGRCPYLYIGMKTPQKGPYDVRPLHRHLDRSARQGAEWRGLALPSRK